MINTNVDTLATKVTTAIGICNCILSYLDTDANVRQRARDDVAPAVNETLLLLHALQTPMIHQKKSRDLSRILECLSESLRCLTDELERAACMNTIEYWFHSDSMKEMWRIHLYNVKAFLRMLSEIAAWPVDGVFETSGRTKSVS